MYDNEVMLKSSFEQWYSLFPGKRVKARIIEMPEEFETYLKTGVFILKDDMFPELKSKVEEAIEELGGSAFVKLNFSAPIDALWVSPQTTMKVQSFEDVVFLLKSSTRVFLDLSSPFGHSRNDLKPIIVLKKWFGYYPNREFRVFAKSETCYAITSRYCEAPCDLDEDQVRELLVPFLMSAFEKLGTSNLILDLYISPKLNVHIVDIQPWHEAASTGLFSWHELQNLDSQELRLCHKSQITNPVDQSVGPIEFSDPTLAAELAASVEEFMKTHP